MNNNYIMAVALIFSIPGCNHTAPNSLENCNNPQFKIKPSNGIDMHVVFDDDGSIILNAQKIGNSEIAINIIRKKANDGTFANVYYTHSNMLQVSINQEQKFYNELKSALKGNNVNLYFQQGSSNVIEPFKKMILD